MRSTSLILAGLILVGPSLLPAPVAAQGVQFELRDDGVRIGRPDYYEPRYDRRSDYRDDYDRYDRRPRGGCSPRQALAAATNFLRSPRIRYANREYYLIDGYGKSGGGRNRPDSVEIYNAPGCDRR